MVKLFAFHLNLLTDWLLPLLSFTLEISVGPAVDGVKDKRQKIRTETMLIAFRSYTYAVQQRFSGEIYILIVFLCCAN